MKDLGAEKVILTRLYRQSQTMLAASRQKLADSLVRWTVATSGFMMLQS